MKNIAHVHRFGDLVAVSVGDGSTHYLTPKAANQLSWAIRQVTRSIDREDFVDSEGLNFAIQGGENWNRASWGYEHKRKKPAPRRIPNGAVA
jgi:hypothetical protein